MCIACELGYLSMVDALEAERAALEKQARGESAFVCEPVTETNDLHEARPVRDEPAP
jgi:hypothetical protein